MTRLREAHSANEAASVTGVPLKQVHRIVDAGLLQGAVENRAGTRVILRKGLVGLKLAYETSELITPEGRRRLIRRLLDRPRAKTVVENAVTVDLRPIQSAIRRGLGILEKARRMVTVDEGVLGGTPCIRGTRIPVHDIAEMIINGDDKSAVLGAYPSLAAAEIELALVYAEAYPRRGRPRRQPAWRRSRPLSSETLSLSELPGNS